MNAGIMHNCALWRLLTVMSGRLVPKSKMYVTGIEAHIPSSLQTQRNCSCTWLGSCNILRSSKRAATAKGPFALHFGDHPGYLSSTGRTSHHPPVGISQKLETERPTLLPFSQHTAALACAVQSDKFFYSIVKHFVEESLQKEATVL